MKHGNNETVAIDKVEFISQTMVIVPDIGEVSGDVQCADRYRILNKFRHYKINENKIIMQHA